MDVILQRPLVIAAGGGIPLHWMAAKVEKAPTVVRRQLFIPFNTPKCRPSDGLVFRPLPPVSRCLGALLFPMIGIDRYLGTSPETGRPLPVESRGQRRVSTLNIEGAGEGAKGFSYPCFPLLLSAFVSHQCPWFQWVTSTSVTAEVAGSSPVVPAIDSKELRGMGTQSDNQSGFDMGAISSSSNILRVCFILRFTQIRNHHPYNLALCGALVRTHRLRVDIKRDPAIGVP